MVTVCMCYIRAVKSLMPTGERPKLWLKSTNKRWPAAISFACATCSVLWQAADQVRHDCDCRSDYGLAVANSQSVTTQLTLQEIIAWRLEGEAWTTMVRQAAPQTSNFHGRYIMHNSFWKSRASALSSKVWSRSSSTCHQQECVRKLGFSVHWLTPELPDDDCAIAFTSASCHFLSFPVSSTGVLHFLPQYLTLVRLPTTLLKFVFYLDSSTRIEQRSSLWRTPSSTARTLRIAPACRFAACCW